MADSNPLVKYILQDTPIAFELFPMVVSSYLGTRSNPALLTTMLPDKLYEQISKRADSGQFVYASYEIIEAFKLMAANQELSQLFILKEMVSRKEPDIVLEDIYSWSQSNRVRTQILDMMYGGDFTKFKPPYDEWKDFIDEDEYFSTRNKKWRKLFEKIDPFGRTYLLNEYMAFNYVLVTPNDECIQVYINKYSRNDFEYQLAILAKLLTIRNRPRRIVFHVEIRHEEFLLQLRACLGVAVVGCTFDLRCAGIKEYTQDQLRGILGDELMGRFISIR